MIFLLQYKQFQEKFLKPQTNLFHIDLQEVYQKDCFQERNMHKICFVCFWDIFQKQVFVPREKVF